MKRVRPAHGAGKRKLARKSMLDSAGNKKSKATSRLGLTREQSRRLFHCWILEKQYAGCSVPAWRDILKVIRIVKESSAPRN
jgi:hypothetical protein